MILPDDTLSPSGKSLFSLGYLSPLGEVICGHVDETISPLGGALVLLYETSIKPLGKTCESLRLDFGHASGCVFYT